MILPARWRVLAQLSARVRWWLGTDQPQEMGGHTAYRSQAAGVLLLPLGRMPRATPPALWAAEETWVRVGRVPHHLRSGPSGKLRLKEYVNGMSYTVL